MLANGTFHVKILVLFFLVLIVLKHDANCIRSFDNNHLIIRLSFRHLEIEPILGDRGQFVYHFGQIVSMPEERDVVFFDKAILASLKMLEGLVKEDPDNVWILENLRQV